MEHKPLEKNEDNITFYWWNWEVLEAGGKYKENITKKKLRKLQPDVEGHSTDIFSLTLVLFKRTKRGDKQENPPIGMSSFVMYAV